MTPFSFPQPGTAARGIRLLYEKSLLSVLLDYSEAVPETLGGVLWGLIQAGFKIRDLTRDGASGHRGILIYRTEGDNVVPVAFVTTPRKLPGGCAIDVCRFDRGNRIDTFKIKPKDYWN